MQGTLKRTTQHCSHYTALHSLHSTSVLSCKPPFLTGLLSFVQFNLVSHFPKLRDTTPKTVSRLLGDNIRNQSKSVHCLHPKYVGNLVKMKEVCASSCIRPRLKCALRVISTLYFVCCITGCTHVPLEQGHHAGRRRWRRRAWDVNLDTALPGEEEGQQWSRESERVATKLQRAQLHVAYGVLRLF
jgi:hypothetical protein